MKDWLAYIPIAGLILQFIIAPIAYSLKQAIHGVLNSIETQKKTLNEFMTKVMATLKEVQFEQSKSAERHLKTEHLIEEIQKELHEIRQDVYRIDGRVIALERSE